MRLKGAKLINILISKKILTFVNIKYQIMGDFAKRILFVNSEMSPYLPDSHISLIGRNLPQGIQERKREIRSFMPRYGGINERKNQLHEVIRLSGMNIIINDVDRPLIVKVASIASARLQVYFIDNDDYFRRRQTFFDENGNFFEDNAERAVFFARGVLETVKKLRWSPDIIHCHGWISHVLPLYLKKVYKDDPIFSSCKIVTSFYDDTPKTDFCADFSKIAKFGNIADGDVAQLAEPTGINLAKLAAVQSDGIIMGSDAVAPEIIRFCDGLGVPVLGYSQEAMDDGSWIDKYNSFYDKLY